ncbi:hypothetical protein Tco_0615973 [Tanacetum coccineum]
MGMSLGRRLTVICRDVGRPVTHALWSIHGSVGLLWMIYAYDQDLRKGPYWGILIKAFEAKGRGVAYNKDRLGGGLSDT